MKLAISQPWFFILIPILFLIIYYSGRVLMMEPAKRRAAIVRRCVMALLLVCALSGIRISLEKYNPTTVFLVDVSDSMAGNVAQVTGEVVKAIGDMPQGNKAGVIAFGAEATVEQFVTEQKLFGELQTTPVSTATNLEKAIQAGIALFPADSAKRLVLITDGNQNQGDLLEMSANVMAGDIATYVYKLENNIGEEVYISDMQVPEKIAVGDTFQVEVHVESTVETSAKLSLYADKKLKKEERVSLSKGENTFIFQDTRKDEGFVNYRAVIEPGKDQLSVNNEYVAFTQAEVGDKILVIEGQEGNTAEFRKILEAANISYDRVRSATAPDSLKEMNQYKSIVLVDVYAEDLRQGFLDNLENYVKNYGGGLVCVGGQNCYALGGYKDTPLEKVLPVNMDLQGEKEIPQMAMVMVIDHSGSMMGDSTMTVSPLDMAKEAAASALDNLRDIDEIGVLTFDDTFGWASRLGVIDDREKVREKIYSIAEGGGTSIYPAVNAAYEAIKKSDAKIKHIILLTDGQDSNRGYDKLLEQIVGDGISLSTVAVGNDADSKLLSNLAANGGGRYYQTRDGDDLPRIFAQEVYLSTDTYLVNRTFTPEIVKSTGILEGVADAGLPQMYGYVATTKKDTATSILVSDEKEPILTSWQYGLGKTVAFASDAENRWTAEYAGWEEYPAFWKNIISWTESSMEDSDTTLAVTQEGSTAKVVYTTKEYDGDSEVSVVYTDEDGQEHEQTLEATAPGTFEGTLGLSKTGVYNINVRQNQSGDIVRSRNATLTMQYSAEYRYDQTTNVLEDFVAQTGGESVDTLDGIFKKRLKRVTSAIDTTMALLVICILLFMYDVAARRLQMSIMDLLPKRKSVPAEAVAAGHGNADRKISKSLGETGAEGGPQKTSSKSAKKQADKAPKQTRQEKKEAKKAEKQRMAEAQREKMLDTSALLKRKEERER